MQFNFTAPKDVEKRLKETKPEFQSMSRYILQLVVGALRNLPKKK